MKRNRKSGWNIFASVLIYIALLGAVLLAASRVAGYRPFTVMSGSMEPSYPTGSLIYVKQVEETELGEGDVITFLLDKDTTVTHRIVEVIPDKEDSSVIRYRTKGDANRVEDGGLVHSKNVIGTPVAVIPKLGYVLQFLQSPAGRYLILFTGIFFLLMAILPGEIQRKNQSIKGKKTKKERRATR